LASAFTSSTSWELSVELEARHGDAHRNAGPVDRRGEDHAHIGCQGQRSPSQETDIAVVGNEDDRQQRAEPEGCSEEDVASARQQGDGGAHRRKVGTDIDCVGREQPRDRNEDDGPREAATHVEGEPAAGHPSDARADGLHRHHQRPGQDQGPHQAEAGLGTCLRIGGDAAGVVVGRAGDQARPDTPYRAGAAAFGRGCRLRGRRCRHGHAAWLVSAASAAQEAC